jgi:putative transposase
MKTLIWLFYMWSCDGTLQRIHHTLYVAVREQAGREASPTVAIIDTQTAKGAPKGVLARSFRLRHGQRSNVASGTSWSIRWVLLNVVVHPADVQDRDGAFHLCAGRADCSRSSSAFSPMADMPENEMARVVWRTGA